jgi:hypothetical protein
MTHTFRLHFEDGTDDRAYADLRRLPPGVVRYSRTWDGRYRMHVGDMVLTDGQTIGLVEAQALQKILAAHGVRHTDLPSEQEQE